MQRRPLLAGNWKMYTNRAEAEALASALAAELKNVKDRDIMIAPPNTALSSVSKVISRSPILLAAQNVCWEEKGAFTGEVSPMMLKDVGCELVIIGHSERRQIFGESNALINKRLLGAQKYGLIPVFCIGETIEQREANQTFSVLESQMRNRRS